MYIVSPITVLDNDHELWETYVGQDTPGMPLDYSVWSKTEAGSREKAHILAHMLNGVSGK